MSGVSGDELLDVAALVALLRISDRPAAHIADLLENLGSAHAVLEEEHGLLAAELAQAAWAEVRGWTEQGIRLLPVLDPDYPENLRAVHDRPPLIFLRGELSSSDSRGVAVIGSRRATPTGLERARAVTGAFSAAGYTIVSGLAAGIDTTVHLTALDLGARTVAVVGTGLRRFYPPENEPLQGRIAVHGAVISRFWPDEGPSRKTFPLRNAVMSGLTLATVIVEAGPHSGARTQARQALGHGRPVLLAREVLGQSWAQRLAERPGVHVFGSPSEAASTVGRISSIEAPVS